MDIKKKIGLMKNKAKMILSRMKFKKPSINLKGVFEKLKKPSINFKGAFEKLKKRKEEKAIISDIEKDLEEKRRRKEEIKRRIEMKDLRKLRIKRKKVKREKYKLKDYLRKAGLTIDPTAVSKRLFNICIFINLLVSAYVIYFFSVNYNYTLYYAVVNMFILWTVMFFVVLLIVWLAFHVMIDLRIFHRKVTIEAVLPDFLQLTSANIRAGMPIDQSLWYAVRPRFGILAKEIELVAKETMGGVDLKDALISFSNKYNSLILKRSVSMLIEGMNAGGEVGELLNRIALNIHDSQIMQKEMAANVTTYVIFIGFATLIAAPFLFALSSQLLTIMTTLTSTVNVPSSVGIGVSFSQTAIDRSDFMIYSITSLLLTAMFSAMIIAIIRKGNIRGGFKYIPRFMIVVVTIYLLASWALERLFATLI